MTIKRLERGDVACAASRVNLACVALTLPGLPGVWNARSPLIARQRGEVELNETGGVRAARAPPRGLLVVSGPHMMTMMVLVVVLKRNECESFDTGVANVQEARCVC